MNQIFVRSVHKCPEPEVWIVGGVQEDVEVFTSASGQCDLASSSLQASPRHILDTQGERLHLTLQ